MNNEKLINNFLDTNHLGQAAGFLYAQVTGGMLPLYLAKERFAKFVDARSEITENAKVDENYIKMFDNLFSGNEEQVETARKFFFKEKEYWSPTFSNVSNALGDIAFDLGEVIDSEPNLNAEELEILRKSTNLVRKVSKDTAFRR